MIDRSSEEQSKLRRVSVGVFRLFSAFSKSAIQHREATKDLLKELGKVRKLVIREYQHMEEMGASNEEIELVTMTKRKRLMFLFMKDLSSGLSGEVLSSKFRKDSQMSGVGSRQGKLNRVSWTAKVMAGLCVSLLDGGMLFYVYLFAMNQTHSRQKAWFVSFVMWLGFEIFLSSTCLVLVLHLLIPLYVWSDVSEVKEKVLTDLMRFREKYFKRNEIPCGDIPGNDIEMGTTGFNAAKYFFTSWRVAFLFPELPESHFVLLFNTPWPKKKFGKEEGNVAKEYEDDVLLSAASRILLYFLTSLLHYSALVQDILIQTVCNGGLGYMCVLLIQLWTTRPLLTGLVILVSLLCLYYLGRLMLSDLAEKLSEEANRLNIESKRQIPSLEEDEAKCRAGTPKETLNVPEAASPLYGSHADENHAANTSANAQVPLSPHEPESSESDLESQASFEISDDSSEVSSVYSSDIQSELSELVDSTLTYESQ